MDHPVALKFRDSLSKSYIAEWQQPLKESEAAKDYEDPTYDRDRSGALFHLVKHNTQRNFSFRL